MTSTTKPGAELELAAHPVLVTRRDVLTGAMAISIGCAAGSTLSIAETARQPGRATSLSREALLSLFRSPPQDFRPVDCWWWEGGKVDREKLVWQLRELKDKGVGGTWFYVRYVYGEALSSIPQYWTEEWWNFTSYAVEQHRQLGLRHYFSNWTLTQFQQDLVRKEKQTNPALEGRRLVLYRLDREGTLELQAGDEVVDVAAYRAQGDSIDHSSRQELAGALRDRKLTWKPPAPGWIVTIIAARPWDLDYVSETVGRRFSEAFLGEYARRLPEHIGSTLEAFGADEMILLNGATLYAPSLLEKVRTERGYDPRPWLIGLFFDIGSRTDQIRCDYYDALTALLEANFYRAPGAWLEQRGMKHATLSQLGGGDLLEQTAQLGDFFRYLRTFHEPGNEDPLRTEPGKRRLIATKLTSSIAHLYERNRAVMCVHYSSGWGMTQEENVAWTNESFAKGLNFYNRHGAFHTLMGGWYEWVPPADHFYQPHWIYWKPFSDYVTRLSAILSQGRHRADVALFYPLTTIHANWVAGRGDSGWTPQREMGQGQLRDPFDPPAARASESVQALAEAVYHDGIDFDFLDNESLERAQARDGILEVAGIEFRSIVLPATTTIRLACAKKLHEFYESGGTIVAFERLPTASADDGRDDPKLAAIVQTIFGPVSPAGIPSVTERTNARGGKAFFVSSDVHAIPAVLSRAIVRDVVAPEKDLFHIHKKVGDLDVYFLFNVREEKRRLPVRFRAVGNVDIWDAHTGEARPVHRVKRDGQTSEVTLTMEPTQGIVLVFSPGAPAPAVLEDDVSEVVAIETQGPLTLRGFDANGGRKTARILHEGRVYTAQAHVAAPPRRIALEGPFSFRLEPTMDNRWGDYRYPASNRIIGAEARRFRYRDEGVTEGTELGWHQAAFDDSEWEQVVCSYGPYWWHIGPFAPDSEPRELIEQAARGEVDLERPWGSGSDARRWRHQIFSKKFGYSPDEKVQPRLSGLEGLLGVPDNFLLLHGPEPGGDVHYLFTSVHAPDDGDYFLHFGSRPDRLFFSLPVPQPPHPLPKRARAWVNGQELPLGLSERSPDTRAQVRLRRGANPVLLEIVRPDSGAVAVYAAFFESEPPEDNPYIPLLRWFREPQRLLYDVTPAKTHRVGWYRFQAPPGMRAMELQVQGRGVRAWVDGEPVPIENNKIVLAQPRPRVSQVALRVEQEPGSYGGAALPEPIAFECVAGQISLGDWSESGLATYSGIGIYGKDFELNREHLRSRIFVDLGVARSVAEVLVNGKSAGVRLARPFRFDVTQLVRTGRNRLEVKVANTLANHMSTYPTRWVLEGQTVSGLLGPVELIFESPVKMIAERADA